MKIPKEVKVIIDYYNSLKKFDVDTFKSLHSPKQQEYFNALEKYVMYMGGRRAGKTLGNVADCVITDLTVCPEKEGRIPFASATIGKTKDLYWTPLLRVSKSLGLGWTPRSQENAIQTRYNKIVFRGLKDIPSADLDYGFIIKRAYIEEVQTIRQKVLKHYLENVISWGMTGIAGARINFTGNPPSIKIDYLEELYKRDGIRKIHTTMHDNPGISKEEIIEIMMENAKFLGKTLEEAKKDPVFRRNVYGEWVYSNELKIFDSERIETFEKISEELQNYRIVMGVDIGGGKAQDAIVVIGYNMYKDELYLLDEQLIDSKDQDLEDLATNIKKFYKHYEDQGCPPDAIAIDTGGIGQRVSSILRMNYGVTNLVQAKKTDKMSYLETMRTEIYKKRFKFKKNSILKEEFDQIIYTADRSEVDDKEGLHSDLLDACLYSFRHIHSKFPQRRPLKENYTRSRIEERLKRMNLPRKKNEFNV